LRTIAVDLDDTLNNFTQTLRETPFAYHERYAVSPTTFAGYLERLRGEQCPVEDLLSTEFSYFRARIHLECYERAQARADGVAFMQWLKREGWRIVICTHRDLRTAYRATKDWLECHQIPFDHVFRAGNKIVFCKLWGIAILVDDHPFNIEYGGRYGVQVFYPLTAKTAAITGEGARGFQTFTQIMPWIAESL
jgi:hypothetical protein